MAHYKVILAYDGTHYRGSQRQLAEIRTVRVPMPVCMLRAKSLFLT